MKSWKTTLGGCIAALGVYFQNQTGWQTILGQVLSAVGLLLIGASAKDNNVTGGTKQQ